MGSDNLKGALYPTRTIINGQYVRLEPTLGEKHFDRFWEEIKDSDINSLMHFMFYGPFESKEEVKTWFYSLETYPGRLFFSIIDKMTERVLGVFSYMEIVADMGTIELGCVLFTNGLQKSRLGTESVYLMIQNAFENLGYRRFEWKCDNNNTASKRAALRYGFSPEGVFRQHKFYKGRNRDTAWFSILDKEWPSKKEIFLRWLDDSNFDVNGNQIVAMSNMHGN